MGSPMGETINAKPTAGAGNQQSFVNALTSATIGPNGQFQGVPGYGGQLTPNLGNSLANSVWNQWSPNAPGMSMLGGNQGYNPNAGMGGMMGGPSNNVRPGLPASLGGAANMPGPGAQGFGGYNANNANMNSPWMTNGSNQYSPNGYNMNNGQSASSLLTANAMGYGAGQAVDNTPAWQAMVGAQNQNLQTGADQMAEQFNNGGGLFSSAYGNAQGQYQSNARAQQNAQLTQGQLQSMLAAQGIQANAAGQLGQQQLGVANSMNNMYNSNMQLGGQLGQQQLGAQQNALTAQYQNWFAQQAYNNPLLAMMYSQANSYAPPPTQTQGWLAPVMGGLGAMAQGAGAMMAA